ncbi:MAG: hypothetical protein GWO04_47120, partial [Actinobacteria bacterium]|nr:hypothetical protein [Actinomycetota bacterium]
MVEETENLFLRFDTFSNGTSWNLFATFVDVNTNSQEAVFNLNMGD